LKKKREHSSGKRLNKGDLIISKEVIENNWQDSLTKNICGMHRSTKAV